MKAKRQKKIDLEKIDKLVENAEEAKQIIENWVNKSLKDQDLPYDTALQKAAEELGLNKAEFVTFVYGREQFHDMAYYIDLSETIREGRFEKDKILKRLGFVAQVAEEIGIEVCDCKIIPFLDNLKNIAMQTEVML